MKKIKNIIKEPKAIIITIIFFLVVSSFIGFSYAWFSSTATGNDGAKGATVTTAIKSLEISDATDISYNSISPGWTATKTFTVTNTGDVTVYYKLIWKEMTNTFTRVEDLTYTITSTNNGGSITSTQLPSTGTNIEIQDSIKIDPSTTQVYTVTFSYTNLDNIDQSEDIGKSFSGIIDIKDGTFPLFDIGTFAYTLIKNNQPKPYTTHPGREESTTDEGLIEGPVDDYEAKTYYFRGSVQDNYVTFASKIWRVVRINGDGSVRLILDSTAGNSAWNTNWKSTNWTTAQSYSTYSNSTIKGNLQTWYNTNIASNSDYSSKIASTKFCNDRTYTTGSPYYNFGAYNRVYPNGNISNADPSFVCPTNTSEANDVYNLNIGLLSADEVAFAGSTYNRTNTSYYLYNSSITNWWWTISPSYWYVSVGNVYIWNVNGTSGHLDYQNSYANYSGALRPVISLDANLTVTTESPTNPGTSGNPYIVE